jgi:uncharacterized protein YciI
MQFLVAGIFKQGIEQRLLDLRDEWNEHLSQPFRNISMFGALRDKDGRRIGYIAFIEAQDFADAETFLEQSPFYEHGLYERVQVAEFNPEVGQIEA